MEEGKKVSETTYSSQKDRKEEYSFLGFSKAGRLDWFVG